MDQQESIAAEILEKFAKRINLFARISTLQLVSFSYPACQERDEGYGEVRLSLPT
jgi:hypothetical protein